MKYSSFIILLVSLTIVAEAGYANEPQFRRDLLQSAFGNWQTTMNATYESMLSEEKTHLGSMQVHRFNTTHGSSIIRVHLDAEGKAYDVGLVFQDDNPGFSTDIQTITERFLWALQLSDLRLQRTFFNASNMQVDFGVLGGLDEQLNAYRAARSNRQPLADIMLEQTEDVYIVHIPVGNETLRISFQPALSLLLNGQTDIVTDFLHRFLTDDDVSLPSSESSFNDIHQFQTSESQIRFTAFSQQMVPTALEYSNTGDYSLKTSFENVEELRAYRYRHWSSWPFWSVLQGYTSQLKPADVRLVLEGVDLYELDYVAPDKIADLAVFLSDGMVVLTDTEAPVRQSNGNYLLTTFVVFHHPDLAYQHMVRIRETFSSENGSLEQIAAQMHVLLTVRLDNVRNLYAQHFGSSVSDPVLLRIRQ